MTTISATNARAQLFSLLRRATHGGAPVRVQYRQHSVVLLSEEDFDGLLETIDLLSAPQFRTHLKRAEEDVRAGRLTPIEKIFPRKQRMRRSGKSKRTRAS